MFFSLASSTKLLARSASFAASAASIFSRDQRLVIPQSRIDLEIGEFRRIVLRRQDRAGVARMRPQRRAGRRATPPYASQRAKADPQPFHPKNPDVFANLA